MTDTITPEERQSWRERLESPFSCHDAKHGAFTLRLLNALETAKAELRKAEDHGDELESQLQDAESEYNANWAVQAITDVARLVDVLEQCQGTGDDIGAATLEAVQDLKAEKEQAEAQRDKVLQMNAERQAAITETALNALLAGITGEKKSVGLNVAGYGCPYCGERSKTVADATAHDATCPKHPAVVRAVKAEADLSRVKGAGIEALRRAEEAEAENADIGTCDVCGFMFDLTDGRGRQDGDYSNPGKSFCPACVARDENARLAAERDWLATELAELHDTSLMLVDGAPEGSNRAPYWTEAARRAVAGEGEVRE